MNILFYAPNFHPLIGGVENIVKGMAMELTTLGHIVRVLTLAKSNEPDQFSFTVIRGANSVKSLRHIRWANVIVHVNISLRGVLPMLLVPRPLIVYHNGNYQTTTITGRLKWLVSRKMAINVGCSPYISNLFNCVETVPNPYRDALFRRIDTVTREKTLLFLGRLVSDKGCDILLHALHLLKNKYKLTPQLTIVGDGPEKLSLTAMTAQLGIDRQVRFEGSLVGEELVQVMNQHQILVVPSNYDEPFGAVVVEGIACGCFVICSDGGGLPDTVGSCGVTFPKGNHVALADILHTVLTNPAGRDVHSQRIEEHLCRHSLRSVTEQFVTIFDDAITT